MEEIFYRNKTKKLCIARLRRVFESPFMGKRSNRKADIFIYEGYK